LTARGNKDLRGAYGLHAREMLMWLHQLQHTRGKHVVFIGILERVLDDFNHFAEFRLQMEGQRVPREISGIIDEFIVMDWVDFGDHAPTRAFVCNSPKTPGIIRSRIAAESSTRLSSPISVSLSKSLFPVPIARPKLSRKHRSASHGL
jgi:hypothetical protein